MDGSVQVDVGNKEAIPNKSEVQQTNETAPTDERKHYAAAGLLYTVEEVPPWYYCIFLGLQHYLVMFGSTVAVPYLLSPALCIGETDPARGYIISTIIFASGIITLLQTSIGVRLPIVQGGTFAFLVPTLAILNLPEWRCPEGFHEGTNGVMIGNHTLTEEEREELWMTRMRVIQGAITVAPLTLIFLSVTGLIGKLLRYITPLTVTPVITLIGLALFESASNMASGHWGISAFTIFLLLFFSQYLRELGIPCCYYSRADGMQFPRFPLFKLFPLLFAIVVSWVLCGILTITDVLPHGNSARTDKHIDILYGSPWIRLPYPGQWGAPHVTVAGVVGIMAGVIAATIESIGNYYASARLAGAPPPPVHAVNRGIFFEGFGCFLAGVFGTGNGTTSYGENVGAMAVSKVGSRRVIQVAACFMLFFGIMAKLGALFVTIPDPIIGSVFFIVFGMIAAVGLSNLQFVDLNSSRNLMIIGFSHFCGLAFPVWFSQHQNAFDTGSDIMDQVFQVLLSSNMFVGGFFGFILDNTVPGTLEERGLVDWLDQQIPGEETNYTYDIPFITRYIRTSKKLEFLKYFPLSPTYEPENFQCPKWLRCCRKRKTNMEENSKANVKERTNTSNGGTMNLSFDDSKL